MRSSEKASLVAAKAQQATKTTTNSTWNGKIRSILFPVNISALLTVNLKDILVGLAFETIRKGVMDAVEMDRLFIQCHSKH